MFARMGCEDFRVHMLIFSASTMFSIALAPSLRHRMHSCAFICCGIVARVRVGDVGCRASSRATVLSTPRLQLCPSAAGVLATTCSGLLVTGATLNLQVPEPAVQQVPVLHFLLLRDTADADVTQGTVRLKAFVHGGGGGCRPMMPTQVHCKRSTQMYC